MLSVFQLVAILLTLTAAFAWINVRFLGLPSATGMTLVGLATSGAVLGLQAALPTTRLLPQIQQFISGVSFHDVVINGMLGLLLFAGAIQVDVAHFRSRALFILTLATAGVAATMAIIGVAMWAVGKAFGFPLPLSWAMVFGALIAPTDPVAVISTLKRARLPKSLETDIPGEALFNDGVAIAIFTIALHFASGSEPNPTVLDSALLIMHKVFGSGAIGLVSGGIAYFALRAIDDFSTEVLISVALVTSTYAIADALHASGPIAVVIAGLPFGTRLAEAAMSERTRAYVFGFWHLADDILNAMLFLLIGLEVLVIGFNPQALPLGLGALAITSLARFIAVSGAIGILKRWCEFNAQAALLMTWAGIRGGVSVALALSLPESASREIIIATTYWVALFSILLQGLTFAWGVGKISPAGVKGGL